MVSVSIPGIRGKSMTRTLSGVAVAALLLLPAGVFGQTRGLGRITGTVRDDAGTPIVGVTITASVKGAKGEIVGATDDKGAWAVSGVAKGEWHIEFRKPGYVPLAARVVLEADLARVPPISINLRKGA
jgi:hypothetical protein